MLIKLVTASEGLPVFQIWRKQLLLIWSYRIFTNSRYLKMMTSPIPIKLASNWQLFKDYLSAKPGEHFSCWNGCFNTFSNSCNFTKITSSTPVKLIDNLTARHWLPVFYIWWVQLSSPVEQATRTINCNARYFDTIRVAILCGIIY